MGEYKNIIKEITKKNNGNNKYWDFEKYPGKKHIHSLIEYPATMVPDMQSEIIRIISKEINARNIFDPFMGSGTVLIEGLLNGLDIYGADINPLSYLIVKTKFSFLNVNKLYKLKNDFKAIYNENKMFETIDFNNIKKWFREDYVNDLSKIRSCIYHVNPKKYRDFFWLAFATLIKNVCNSRKSTFKLHVKKEIDIKRSQYDLLIEYEKIIDKMINSVSEWNKLLLVNNLYINSQFKNKISLHLGNSINIMNDRRKFKSGEIDIICTSPPYGDNHTTVTYGQYSILQLKWLDLNNIGININNEMLEIDNRIDSISLGGRLYSYDKIINSEILDKSTTLKNIFHKLLKVDARKAFKVATFYSDFYTTLVSQYLLLRDDGCAIYTVGDRNINKTKIPFNIILRELSEHIGFEFIHEITRTIYNSKIASSIKDENLVILKK